MTPVLILMVIFGSITIWKKMSNEHAEKMARIKAGDSPAALAGSSESAHAMEERLGHLEEIVCSVDFELNAKLNNLASRQLALPSPGPGVTAAEGATTMPAPAALDEGQEIGGRFVIERLLGAGGMGAVYLARDKQLGEPVALKIIAGLALLDPAASDRLRREASAARRVAHKNVVRIHDIGEESGWLFLSMEYVSGTSLKDLIDRHGKMPLAQVREVLVQICDGLAAAHAQGIVHRDLKPANVLVAGDGTVKIIDFGLARMPHAQGMTSTGVIMGTPEYMAPEQIKGGTIEPRTDIYALGALSYHALLGRPPFTGANPIAVSLAQATESPPPPRTLREDLPEAWAAWLLSALSKDPSGRPGSIQQMRDALPPVG